MAKPALWPRVRAAIAIVFYAGLTIGALAYADHAIGRPRLQALRLLAELSRAREHELGQTWDRPALVRGTLYAPTPRPTPSGHDSALWYAWVEDLRRSGRSSYAVVVCDAHANTGLALRQADRTVRLDLLNDDDAGALLKGTALESLPLTQVALDLGPLYHSRQIPAAMRDRCQHRLPARGDLTYFEAYVPSGGPVTVLGCASATTLYRCDRPPGVISVRGLQPVLHAYANKGMDPIRGGAGLIGVALCLLASALFKLRTAAGGQS